MNLFLEISPNNGAFTDALERVLGNMWFQLDHQVCLQVILFQYKFTDKRRTLCDGGLQTVLCGTPTCAISSRTITARRSKLCARL
jgi:hypothetical protein